MVSVAPLRCRLCLPVAPPWGVGWWVGRVCAGALFGQVGAGGPVPPDVSVVEAAGDAVSVDPGVVVAAEQGGVLEVGGSAVGVVPQVLRFPVSACPYREERITSTICIGPADLDRAGVGVGELAYRGHHVYSGCAPSYRRGRGVRGGATLDARRRRTLRFGVCGRRRRVFENLPRPRRVAQTLKRTA